MQMASNRKAIDKYHRTLLLFPHVEEVEDEVAKIKAKLVRCGTLPQTRRVLPEEEEEEEELS